MRLWPDDSTLRAIGSRMRPEAERFRLPFRNHVWRGDGGNWQGAGVGSSIDFQDHRQYLPGDDPRYIDWQAYARTGNYSMKLYREEISPRVDLALDVSASMLFDDAKRERALELFCFCAESARQSGSSLRSFASGPGDSVPWGPDAALREQEMTKLTGSASANLPPALARVPWRQGSLRVFISDLLFPGSPEATLAPLSAGKGRGLILVPFCAAESAPDWQGNIELIDSETSRRRVQHIDRDLMGRFAENYRRHFELWKESSRRHAAVMARVPAEPGFADALRAEALPSGAVELTR